MIISILMPVFNEEKHLEACLDSILAQSEKNWELLAVDDQSEDGTWNLLNSYAEKDSRIRIFKNSEKGIIPALRLAFSKSKGELVTRMDADDRMEKGKLKALKELLLKEGRNHIATGLVKYFSEEEMGAGYLKYEAWLNELSRREANFEEIYKECVIPSPCWMMWREDLLACGAFDSNIYPEDYDLCFRFYKKDLKVIASKEILHHWRDYPERSSRTQVHYSRNHYFNLKLPYFLELEYEENRPLVIWGAGKKGKQLARMLEEREVDYYWVCDNSSKWGIRLYGADIQSFEILKKLEEPQIVVVVAAPDGQREIRNFLEECNFSERKHFWFFC